MAEGIQHDFQAQVNVDFTNFTTRGAEQMGNYYDMEGRGPAIIGIVTKSTLSILFISRSRCNAISVRPTGEEFIYLEWLAKC